MHPCLETILTIQKLLLDTNVNSLHLNVHEAIFLLKLTEKSLIQKYSTSIRLLSEKEVGGFLMK